MNLATKKTFVKCWNCNQPATHVMTREGSNTLHACDNCTRIDRAQAESSGWTVSNQTAPDLTAFPDSSVPAAFDRGHLYTPTVGQTRYALDERYIYDYRPGNLFEPMPEPPHGGKEFAWWWGNAARADVPDFLGLRVGDEITIQHVTSVGPGEVIETHRFGAVVRYPMPEGADKKHDEMYVCRRNQSGHWYR